MNFHLRNLETTDFESILEINRESIPHVFELDADEFSQLLELSEFSRVIEIQDEIAGYLFVLGKGLAYDATEYNWFCENLDEDFLYIDQVAVRARWKGMGGGKVLYQDLENHAVQRRITTLVCEVNYKPCNRDSIAFHRRQGFRELSRIEARGMVVSLLVKRGLGEKP